MFIFSGFADKFYIFCYYLLVKVRSKSLFFLFMKVGDYDNGIDPAGEDYPKWMALVDHLKVSLLTHCHRDGIYSCLQIYLVHLFLVDRSVYYTCIMYCLIRLLQILLATLTLQVWNFTFVHEYCYNVCV